MLVASILSPVVMLLLFDFILGGPIGAGLGDAARSGPYVDFLVPGILMMTVAAGSSTSAINVCTDMTGGIIDRFRTMAVSSGAVLAGHVGGGVLHTLVTTAVVTVVALLIGFRPKAAVEAWFAFLVQVQVTLADRVRGQVARLIHASFGRRPLVGIQQPVNIDVQDLTQTSAGAWARGTSRRLPSAGSCSGPRPPGRRAAVGSGTSATASAAVVA